MTPKTSRSPRRGRPQGPADPSVSDRSPNSHQESAEEAGLRYVTDQMPGIRRVRTGDGFEFIGANGHRITNPERLRRLKALAIPPAWTDVWICPYRRGHLQVTARDARGRKQYRYHPKYRAVRDETKFDRMLEFSKLLPRIRKRVETDMRRRGLPREKVLATVVRLLEKTLIRVGNPEYARENQTYGLTTMRREHVEVTGSRVRFAFRGKSGVVHEVLLTDSRLAKVVQRCQTLPGEELFQYVDDQGRHQSVDSGDINAYLRSVTGRDITAKDFRTWAGTMLAAEALREFGTTRKKTAARSNVIKAIDQVAERLGNTRAVCRSYYIHPGIIDGYLKGRVVPAPPSRKPSRRARPTLELRKEEIEVLKFLELDS